MTVEKRYQVFVSSPLQDLQAERLQVTVALLGAGAIPLGMESFVSSDDTVWAYIQRVIRQCDYYVLILGGRYGSVDEDGLSYTEKEYRFARDEGIPILACVKSDYETLINKSDAPDETKQKLRAFIKEVLKSKMCVLFDSPEGAGWKTAGAFNVAKETHQRTGWVRADQVVTPETSAEVATLRLRVNELNTELLSTKAALETSKKQHLGPPDIAGMDEEYRVEFDSDGPGRFWISTTWRQIVHLVIAWTMSRVTPPAGFNLAAPLSTLFDDDDFPRFEAWVTDEAENAVRFQLETLGYISVDRGNFSYQLTALAYEWAKNNLIVKTKTVPKTPEEP